MSDEYYENDESDNRKDLGWYIYALIGIGVLIMALSLMPSPEEANDSLSDVAKGVQVLPGALMVKSAQNSASLAVLGKTLTEAENEFAESGKFEIVEDEGVRGIADYCINEENPRIVCGHQVSAKVTTSGLEYFVNNEPHGLVVAGLHIKDSRCYIESVFPTDGFCINVK